MDADIGRNNPSEELTPIQTYNALRIQLELKQEGLIQSITTTDDSILDLEAQINHLSTSTSPRSINSVQRLRSIQTRLRNADKTIEVVLYSSNILGIKPLDLEQVIYQFRDLGKEYPLVEVEVKDFWYKQVKDDLEADYYDRKPKIIYTIRGTTTNQESV